VNVYSLSQGDVRAREPADVIVIAAADLAPFRNLMVNDEVAEAPHHHPPPRTKWTRRVPHPVLIGRAASLPH